MGRLFFVQNFISVAISESSESKKSSGDALSNPLESKKSSDDALSNPLESKKSSDDALSNPLESKNPRAMHFPTPWKVKILGRCTFQPLGK